MTDTKKCDGSDSLDKLVRCKCTLSQRLVGDGCSVCNPDLADEHEGKFCGERCPECGAELLKNSFGDKWCSLTSCDYDADDSPNEKHDQRGERACSKNGATHRVALHSLVLCAYVENIIGVVGMTCIVIFAEGGWKWMALLCLLNMNQIKGKKS